MTIIIIIIDLIIMITLFLNLLMKMQLGPFSYTANNNNEKLAENMYTV